MYVRGTELTLGRGIQLSVLQAGATAVRQDFRPSTVDNILHILVAPRSFVTIFTTWTASTTMPSYTTSDGVRGALSPNGSLSPHHETYWSRIRRQIVRHFQILIVSAVKICKHYALHYAYYKPINASDYR